MTQEESDTNDAYNRDVIRVCRHDPTTESSGAVVCRKCGCKFAAVLRPVMHKPLPYAFEDEE